MFLDRVFLFYLYLVVRINVLKGICLDKVDVLGFIEKCVNIKYG